MLVAQLDRRAASEIAARSTIRQRARSRQNGSASKGPIAMPSTSRMPSVLTATATDSRHQGLGLTICRDLACRSEGNVAVVTSNSWITNPEVESEQSRAAPFWQGTVVASSFDCER